MASLLVTAHAVAAAPGCDIPPGVLDTEKSRIAHLAGPAMHLPLKTVTSARSGRSIGLIDTVHLSEVALATKLLSDRDALPPDAALVLGAMAYGEPGWAELWQRLETRREVFEVMRNLPLRNVLLWLPPGCP